MKTSFWDRMLMFLYVLITLAFGLCMALRPFGVDLFGGLFSALEGAAGSFIAALIGLGLAAIVALLSAYMLMMIFRKGKRHAAASFITVNSGDGGQVRIALSALAQMARRAVGRVEGVHEMKINVSGSDDAIEVAVELVMEAGAHVPSVTTNMQRAIRNRIESNCGVAVRDVEVTVTSLAAEDEPQAKKPVWPRKRHRNEEVAAAAAQEAAAPVPEIPAPEPAEEESEDLWPPLTPPKERAEADEGAAPPAEAEEEEIEDADLFFDTDENGETEKQDMAEDVTEDAGAPSEEKN